MGLDITAFSKLRLVADPDEDDYRVWKSEFPARCEEFEHMAAVESAGEKFRGPSIGYHSYSVFRECLAEMAGYPSTPDYEGKLSHAAYIWDNKTPGPFMELIDFSDCQGWIGTAVSGKLAKDFADFQERADRHHYRPFRETYAAFRKAFEVASDGGAVRFH